MNDHLRDSLLNRMGESALDSFIVVHPANIRYLTGYAGDNAFLAITRDRVVLFVYSMNLEIAERTVQAPVEISVLETTAADHFATLGTAFWGSVAGYEPEHMRCSTYRNIVEALKGTLLKPVSGMIESFRIVKRPEEVAAIERAQVITDRVFAEVLGLLREGIAELDIAAEVDYRFRRNGASGPSFETIVAFGAHASMPHAIPDTRKLRNGDFVLIDMGTLLEGYASDMTRTVVFGRASEEQRERYRLVLAAQEAGILATRAGVPCADAFQAAMAVFDAAGYRAAFIHSLGHGIGLEVHELPAVSSRSHESFRAGAVVTVEPGLYFPGWGGIRIEDMVVVTDTGCRSLTASPKTLLEL